MERLEIKTEVEPKIVVENATGDLRIKGWGQREIRADAEGKNSISHTEEDGSLHIKCLRDCYMRVPNDAELEIVNVTGETLIKSVDGPIKIGTAAGSVTMKDTGELEIEQIGANFSGKQIDGDVNIKTTSGHVELRDVEGIVSIESIAGNFVQRGEAAGLTVKTAGDANLRFDPDSGESYHVEASGSILCRIPEESQAKIRLKSGAGSIRVKTFETSEAISDNEHEFTLGDGSSEITLAASGAVQLKTYSFTDSESFSFEFDLDKDFTGIADEITQQVTDQIEGQMEALNEQLNHLTIGLDKEHITKARDAAKKAERRVAAAQRRLERRVAKAQRKAVRQARKSHRHGRGADYGDFLAMVRGEEGSDPVGDAERRMVLEMVQDKKISVVDAENLLAAMEGRAGEEPSEELKTDQDGEAQ
ncbi:MAG: DUF4097 family beta strand repeat-containing protein [Anaerolineae bacterium]|nr:DUF4097 family beta strand repeat-containing protein [Anaerolineae bacterium]